MDLRFKSFYSDKLYPFVDAMVGFPSESGNRVQRPVALTSSMVPKKARFAKNQDYMHKISKELLAGRRAHPIEKKDLLNAMLSGTNPQSGCRTRDELWSLVVRLSQSPSKPVRIFQSTTRGRRITRERALSGW